ncbi:MBL fold metallo-hydrolase [Mucilaginibacter sp. Bleaf8]|uniref:rhodanese-like domain-containing protein n=1 Tax=Mucilaginibacter sp. Bleaf8 TaxID=2834430 RepID=UPI001BD1237E|nr:rhodanese-like domain-containing protein [Mucilaginibacter sp. Bleaf8]MBS7564612.1 MBL fold metallo-hydrolase [Mucilaginibacter sp. Bleaf8]
MLIHQFYDTDLAHASYAIIRAGQMIVVDPARDPQPYYDFATLHEADIVGVIETHPHADFVSSHLEIHETTGATIYASHLLGAAYPHQTFDDGDVIELTDIRLKAINTPGHSPDSICILVEDESGTDTAIFTGDTLFVGDVGRPDLREEVGNITAKKEDLARQMYQSTRQKLMTLPEDVTVYPAHGPGSLCGKNMSPDLHSTIGREMRENYALQLMDELKFVQTLTTDQPFVPHYFGFDVELNKQGAPAYQQSINAVPRLQADAVLQEGIVVIDTRPKAEFNQGHVSDSINLQLKGKFETWLGAVVNPNEPYYLVAADEESLSTAIKRAAKIGYEAQIKGALLTPATATEQAAELHLDDFKAHTENYTIIDARNWNEINQKLLFDNALTIPLPELRNRLDEIPADKPIVVHCAAGYRSAAGRSIVAAKIKTVPVYDLGEVVVEFAV